MYKKEKKKQKILWISRHSPCKSELVELYKMYPQAEVTYIKEKVSAEFISEIGKNYDDIICIVPLSVLRKLVENGIHPLFPQTVEVNDDNYDFVYRGKKYKFVAFRRVKDVQLIFEEKEVK